MHRSHLYIMLVLFSASTAAAQSTQQTLFVANQSSDSISSYRVAADGSLLQLPASPLPAQPTLIGLSGDGATLLAATGTFASDGSTDPDIQFGPPDALIPSVKLAAYSVSGDGSLPREPDDAVILPAGIVALSIVGVQREGRQFVYLSTGHFEVAGTTSAPIFAFELTTSGSVVKLTPVPGQPFETPGLIMQSDAVATPDGRFLYVAKYFIGGISGYAIADNGALTPLPAMPEAAQLCTRIAAMSPDGRHLYVGAVCGLPDIINAVRGFAIADDGMLNELPGSPFLVSPLTVQLADDVAITPDGSKVLVSSSNYPTFGAPVSVMARAADGTLSLVPDSPVITGFTPSGTLVCDDAHAFVVKNGCIGCDVEDPMGIVTLDIGSDGTLESTSALMPAGLSPNHAVLWTPSAKPTTPGDLDGDGDVDGFDLALLLAAWGRCPKSSGCAADLNDDGVVSGVDLAVLLGSWGPAR